MRINRVVAKLLKISRRAADKVILNNKVIVHGKTAELNTDITSNAEIIVNGVKYFYQISDKHMVYMYHKPINQICTRSDPQNRTTVFEFLPKDIHWLICGRLDVDTSGLLLFTNDGDFVEKLCHPKYKIHRTYLAEIDGLYSTEELVELTRNLVLDDGPILIDKIKSLYQYHKNRKTRIELVVSEGRNRAVRRSIKAIGSRVIKLKRIAFGDYVLPDFLLEGDGLYL